MTSLSELKQAFAEPGASSIIDLVMPDGRGAYSHETLEGIRVRYPKAEVVDVDEHCARTTAGMVTEPEEIDEERWDYLLGVLPPQRWVRRGGAESFELMEHTYGNVTLCALKTAGKAYAWQGFAGMSHEDKTDTVLAMLWEQACYRASKETS